MSKKHEYNAEPSKIDWTPVLRALTNQSPGFHQHQFDANPQAIEKLLTQRRVENLVICDVEKLKELAKLLEPYAGSLSSDAIMDAAIRKGEGLIFSGIQISIDKSLDMPYKLIYEGGE